MKEKLLVILGPTATGKTDLGLYLAKKFNGEVIAADSRQVYKGLDIGTGKLPSKNLELKKEEGLWEIDGVKVWMYDVVSTSVQYTVADYVKDAGRVIREIEKEDKLPITVGGTGFYIKALLEGLPNLVVPIDHKLRQDLKKLSLEELQSKLAGLSSTRWNSLNQSDSQNKRRLLRAIELIVMNPHQDTQKATGGLKDQFDIFKIGLTAPRPVLYEKIDRRVLSWIDQGIIEEATRLHGGGLSLERMKSLGLEYGVLADYLEGKIQTEDTLIKVMQGKIHGYLRRQLTWFKKEKGISWFDTTDKNFLSIVENEVDTWYHLAND